MIAVHDKSVTYRWTYRKYQRLAEAEVPFRTRVELLAGNIIYMGPQRPIHAACVGLSLLAVSKSFGPDFWVRCQGPLHLDRWSGPNPDLAVVPGSPRDYVGTGHPKSDLLVLEISDSTLWYDRRRKRARYARAGYQDYWIVNLVDRCLEVYRKPMADPAAPLGWRYADVTIHTPPATIAPPSRRWRLRRVRYPLPIFYRDVSSDSFR